MHLTLCSCLEDPFLKMYIGRSIYSLFILLFLSNVIPCRLQLLVKMNVQSTVKISSKKVHVFCKEAYHMLLHILLSFLQLSPSARNMQ